MTELGRSEPEPVHAGETAHEAIPSGSPGTSARSPAATKRVAAAGQDAGVVAQQRIAQPAVAPAPAPAWSLDEAALLAGKLSDLDAYAYEHPDWITKLKGTPTKEKLWQLIVRVRQGDGFGSGLGEFTVASLLAEDLARGPLARYAASVGSDSASIELSPATTLERARALGAALLKLDTVLPGIVQREVIPQRSAHGATLDLLIDQNLVDSFVLYVRTVRPLLTATNGAEIASFIQFHKDTGGQVGRYAGRLRQVRSPHHFKVEVLERLVASEADTSHSRPLTVILHTATDHNGSFHRDATLDEVVADRRNQVILLEGFATLAAAGASIAEVARKYGQHGKIDQVLITGHGGSRSIEMGATREANGTMKTDAINLDRNAPATQALLHTIVSYMDKGSEHRRIVMHACLTNSEELALGPGVKLAADPVAARKTVAAALAKRPTLAGYLAQLVAQQHGNAEVVGANASTFAGEGQHLIDAQSGALTMSDTRDPSIAANKISYLETGIEPTGVARALVALWARSPTEARAAIERRLHPQAAASVAAAAPAPAGAKASMNNGWPELVGDAICQLALAHWGEAEVITGLPPIAFALGVLLYDKFAPIGHHDATIPKRFRAMLFGVLGKNVHFGVPHVRIVAEQLLAAVDPAAGVRLLELLAASYDAQTASGYLSPPLVVPLLAGAGPMAGKLIVAVNSLNDTRSISFLRSLRVKGRFPPALQVAKVLGGLMSETALVGTLDAQPKEQGLEPSANSLEPNIDLDGDGREDLHLDPMAADFSAQRRTPARTAPKETAPVVAMIERGQPIRVVGATGHWAAIALPGRTAVVFAFSPLSKSEASARAQIKSLEPKPNASPKEQIEELKRVSSHLRGDKESVPGG